MSNHHNPPHRAAAQREEAEQRDAHVLAVREQHLIATRLGGGAPGVTQMRAEEAGAQSRERSPPGYGSRGAVDDLSAHGARELHEVATGAALLQPLRLRLRCADQDPDPHSEPPCRLRAVWR